MSSSFNLRGLFLPWNGGQLTLTYIEYEDKKTGTIKKPQPDSIYIDMFEIISPTIMDNHGLRVGMTYSDKD